jgi:hypothetical protein
LSRFFFGNAISSIYALPPAPLRAYAEGMKNALKKTIDYIFSMPQAAWDVLMGALRLSCTMVFCAFVMLIDLGAPTIENLPVWRGALEYARFPVYLLLCAVFAAAGIDSRLR